MFLIFKLPFWDWLSIKFPISVSYSVGTKFKSKSKRRYAIVFLEIITKLIEISFKLIENDWLFGKWILIFSIFFLFYILNI